MLSLWNTVAIADPACISCDMIIFYPFWQLRGCTIKLAARNFLKIPRTSSHARNACSQLKLATKLHAAWWGGHCHHKPLPWLTPQQWESLVVGTGWHWQSSAGGKPELQSSWTTPTHPPLWGSPFKVTSTPPHPCLGVTCAGVNLVGPELARRKDQYRGWSRAGRKGLERIKVG